MKGLGIALAAATLALTGCAEPEATTADPGPHLIREDDWRAELAEAGQRMTDREWDRFSDEFRESCELDDQAFLDHIVANLTRPDQREVLEISVRQACPEKADLLR